MLTLLRDLRQLRRTVALPRPGRGRSLALRHVDAGSCNGCEHELTLLSSPYYDLQRFGLGIVASPRHADLLLVTGPITTRMREPLLTAYHAMPEPRLVAALGHCALGRGILGTPDTLVGRPLGDVLVDRLTSTVSDRPSELVLAVERSPVDRSLIVILKAAQIETVS